MSDFAKQLEKKIQGKLSSIERGETPVKDSGVNDLIKKLKKYDEASAETLQKKYIEVVKKANKKD